MSRARPFIPPRNVTDPRSGSTRFASPPVGSCAKSARAGTRPAASASRAAIATDAARRRTLSITIIIDLPGWSVRPDRAVRRVGGGVQQGQESLGESVSLALADLVGLHGHAGAVAF